MGHPSLFSHDTGISSLRDHLTVLISKGELGDDKYHSAGAAAAFTDVGVLGSDGDGVPGVDWEVVFVLVPAIQPHPSELDLEVGQLLGPERTQEGRWRDDRPEAGSLRSLLVVIDLILVADRFNKLANGALLDVVGHRGGFRPQGTAIEFH